MALPFWGGIPAVFIHPAYGIYLSGAHPNPVLVKNRSRRFFDAIPWCYAATPDFANPQSRQKGFRRHWPCGLLRFSK